MQSPHDNPLYQEAVELLKNNRKSPIPGEQALPEITSYGLERQLLNDLEHGKPFPAAKKLIREQAERRAKLYQRPDFLNVRIREPWCAEPIPTAYEIRTYFVEAVKKTLEDLHTKHPILFHLSISEFGTKLRGWGQTRARQYQLALDNGDFNGPDGKPDASIIHDYTSIYFKCNEVSPRLPLDGKWWRRRARNELRRAREAAWTRLAPLGMKKGVSVDMLFDALHQDEQAKKWAEKTVYIDGSGKAHSMPGPEKQRQQRKAEILATGHQIQEMVKDTHTAWAVTVTLPEVFHPTTTAKGKRRAVNDGWNLSTPEDCIKWFIVRWNKMRVYLRRRKIDVEFLKVVEPHKDGVPHWHILFFVANGEENRITFETLLYDVFINDKKNPPSESRKKHGLDVKKITNGNAIGYMLKYITKQTSNRKQAKPLSGDNDDTALALDSNPVDWRRAHGLRSFSTTQTKTTIRRWLFRKRFKGYGDSDIDSATKAIEEKDLAAFRKAAEPLKLFYAEIVDDYGYVTRRLDGIFNERTGCVSLIEKCQIMSEKEAERLGLLDVSVGVTVTENNQGQSLGGGVLSDDYDGKPADIDESPPNKHAA